MSAAWSVVLGVGALAIAIKAAGPLLFADRGLPRRVTSALRLLAPAVLAALVVTQVFVSRGSLGIDERALGLAVAATALVLRAPTLLVVVLAAATTAIARLTQ